MGRRKGGVPLPGVRRNGIEVCAHGVLMWDSVACACVHGHIQKKSLGSQKLKRTVKNDVRLPLQSEDEETHVGVAAAPSITLCVASHLYMFQHVSVHALPVLPIELTRCLCSVSKTDDGAGKGVCGDLRLPKE